ncbi:hypothetical protein OC846_005660 [Tilletia horrida]|uniref:Uncharacterized protein n=1 Tax=Tilletia horrida TaxID=155126 RepID=A0AAN6GMJ6_9BASI|nr:hypothetical protein OC845_005829 [Tilletia horrida]KAK0545450.1 hypothetical protein OC846_005660 [Tilletia horrida]KAK0561452.1 hypothetical protein OC861_005804 [Tilletia horrida]
MPMSPQRQQRLRAHSPSLHLPNNFFQFFLICFTLLLLIATPTDASAIRLSDGDQLRQICEGVRASAPGTNRSKITVSFDAGAKGVVSNVFYEWTDAGALGKSDQTTLDRFGYALKTYICTDAAAAQGICDGKTQLGQFIVTGAAPSMKTQKIDFGQTAAPLKLEYPIEKDGFYCVATVPLSLSGANGSTPVLTYGGAGDHANYTGIITFTNKFDGNLPAAEYPKLQFYGLLTLAYLVLGIVWLALCIKHRSDLTILFLIVEMTAQFGYYAYLNATDVDFFTIRSASGNGFVTAFARALLVISSVLDAARNSISLFLLLIVSMGYGVVRPSIGPIMTRVRMLTGLHFVFGVLYSVGVVLITLEAGGGWIFMFVFPLSLTLTAFMMWTLRSLNSTIAHLTARKQKFKVAMFTKLHRILSIAVIVIFLFFVITTIAFGSSLEGSRIWTWRWILLDGWLGTLYFAIFFAVVWIWRPTGQNLRMSMSDEVATDDDAEANDFEIDTFATREGVADDDDDDDDDDIEAANKAARTRAGAGPTVRVGDAGADAPPPYTSAPRGAATTTTSSGSGAPGARHQPGSAEGDPMFSVGEDEDDAEEIGDQNYTPRPRRGQGDAPTGSDAERRGLMGE